MRLSDIPELQNYRHVSPFVRDHLSMQFGDVRAMLRLPIPELGIEDGCNFAVATVLCSLISGISVTIFRPSSLPNNQIGSGRVFRQLLENFYPWEQEENRTEGAEALYDYFRNPLVHALAVERESSHIQISKYPLPLQNEQIEEIERAQIRPSWLRPGLSGSGTQWNLLAEGFYRDVFHMFWNLARDEQQMNAADQRFLAGEINWREE